MAATKQHTPQREAWEIRNTDAKGPALLSGVRSLQNTHFFIYSFGDATRSFKVTIKHASERVTHTPLETAKGTYRVGFRYRYSGLYKIKITCAGIHIKGSVFHVDVQDGLDPKQKAVLTDQIQKVRAVGPALFSGVPPQQNTSIDIIGDIPRLYIVTISGSYKKTVSPVHVHAGIYRAEFTFCRPGPHEIRIKTDGIHIKGSPYCVDVPETPDLPPEKDTLSSNTETHEPQKPSSKKVFVPVWLSAAEAYQHLCSGAVKDRETFIDILDSILEDPDYSLTKVSSQLLCAAIRKDLPEIAKCLISEYHAVLPDSDIAVFSGQQVSEPMVKVTYDYWMSLSPELITKYMTPEILGMYSGMDLSDRLALYRHAKTLPVLGHQSLPEVLELADSGLFFEEIKELTQECLTQKVFLTDLTTELETEKYSHSTTALELCTERAKSLEHINLLKQRLRQVELDHTGTREVLQREREHYVKEMKGCADRRITEFKVVNDKVAELETKNQDLQERVHALSATIDDKAQTINELLIERNGLAADLKLANKKAVDRKSKNQEQTDALEIIREELKTMEQQRNDALARETFLGMQIKDIQEAMAEFLESQSQT